jgi:negative regulator of sigma E activity
MDTFFAKNRLSAYLDGALPEREAAEVADAITRDPELQAEYEALRAALGTLRQHGPVSAPEGFKARVMARVDREASTGGIVVQLRRRLSRVPLEAVAVAAAALLVVFTTTLQMTDSASPSPDMAKPAPAALPVAAAPDVSSPPAADVNAAAAPADAAKPPPPSPEQTTPQKTRSTAPANKPATAPDAAYVPGWESDEDQQEAAFGSIEGLALSVSDPKVLEKLYVITDRAGGRMLDEGSQSLRPYALSADDPVARVVLMVPVKNAATLRGQLMGLGATAGAAPAGGPTLAAGYSGFYIETRLLP